MEKVQNPHSNDIICISCGGKNNLSQHNCSYCGRELPSPNYFSGMENPIDNSENLICQVCQHRNRPGSRYCAICGTKLESVPGSISKSSVSSLQSLAADTPVATIPPQQNQLLEQFPAPTIDIQGDFCCPRCLLPCRAEANVCTYCGYTGLSDKAATRTQIDHTIIPSETAMQSAPAQHDSPVEPKAINNSSITCPVCGKINSTNLLNCGNCGYSFTYRQEVSDRPVKQVKTREVVGFIIFFIIFIFLIGIGFIYIFTS